MDSLAQIALTMTPGIGPTSCRKLMELCNSADELFSLGHGALVELFGNHADIVKQIEQKSAFARAEEELRFIERNGIHALFFTDEQFPQRLNRQETSDCPTMLYVMGDANLNADRTVAIVGTRKATPQGRDNTARLVAQLKAYKTPIVSGLAYGIDTAAHTAAVDQELPTIAVLGHGLDRIYPPSNRQLAADILSHGGALVTEYPSGTAINPRYFPARNRIIASMTDATVVVEASEKGGALITAAIAASYHREVFALPGRLTDTYSLGTNNLIATNKALLIRTADDIAFQMGWPTAGANSRPSKQTELFPTLSAEEQQIVTKLQKHDQMTLDEVANDCGYSLPKAAALMFNLEMQQVVRSLPGHLYQLCRN